MSETPPPDALNAAEDTADDCNVICPYCGNSYQAEAEDFDEDEREETCFSCKRVYLMHDECTVTHYARPKPELAAHGKSA